jgi:hypothetical protein
MRWNSVNSKFGEFRNNGRKPEITGKKTSMNKPEDYRYFFTSFLSKF